MMTEGFSDSSVVIQLYGGASARSGPADDGLGSCSGTW